MSMPNTIIGGALIVLIGSLGLNVVLPKENPSLEKTAAQVSETAAIVTAIQSDRYTSADAERDWRLQAEMDISQNAKIQLLAEEVQQLKVMLDGKPVSR